MYFTLVACGVGIWLMVSRFGLKIDQLLSYALLTVCLIAVLIGMAAGFAYLIRLIRDRKE